MKLLVNENVVWKVLAKYRGQRKARKLKRPYTGQLGTATGVGGQYHAGRWNLWAEYSSSGIVH